MCTVVHVTALARDQMGSQLQLHVDNWSLLFVRDKAGVLYGHLYEAELRRVGKQDCLAEERGFLVHLWPGIEEGISILHHLNVDWARGSRNLRGGTSPLLVLLSGWP